MAQEYNTRLWLVTAAYITEKGDSSLHGMDRCFTRGLLSGVDPARGTDVSAQLHSGSVNAVVATILQDLKNGLQVCYVTGIPLDVDQVACSLRQRLPESSVLLQAAGESFPALPQQVSGQLKAGLVLLDGSALKGAHYPPFSPAQTALIFDPSAAGDREQFQKSLAHVYPAAHTVYTLPVGDPNPQWLPAELASLDLADSTLLLIPPRSADSSLESFAEIIARLRAPDGCPWDRKQTHDSLRTYLLEETYEALADLDEKNMPGLKEELGDLVLQILLHAEIGVEKSEFNLSEILEGINRKIIYRHPHVFGEIRVSGVRDVVQNWEKLKEKEREENGKEEVKGLLDGVPPSFPALAQAQAIQDRAARVGFDWTEIAPVKAKVMEEMDEVYTAPDEAHRAKELGDLLFAVVNLVRWYKVDAESALRETNLKFRRRFSYIEQKSRENGKPMLEMTLDEMDAFWEEAKKTEK